jgi:hypothetical protein
MLGNRTCASSAVREHLPIFIFLNGDHPDFSGIPNPEFRILNTFQGGLAQLVERQLCKLDVRSSNLLTSK